TVLAEGDAVVVATSYLASQFTQTSPIPIVPIRGQLSYVEASPESSALSAVVCGQSYVSPAWEGLHSVGASYSKDLEETALTEREHAQNLEGIAPRLPSGSLTPDAIIGGRASIRATT